MKNKSTVSKTKQDLKRAEEWLAKVGKPPELYGILRDEPNLLLDRAWAVFQCTWLTTIITDEKIKHFRDVLNSKREFKKKQGLGNKKDQIHLRMRRLTYFERKNLLGPGIQYWYVLKTLISFLTNNNTKIYDKKWKRQHKLNKKVQFKANVKSTTTF